MMDIKLDISFNTSQLNRIEANQKALAEFLANLQVKLMATLAEVQSALQGLQSTIDAEQGQVSDVIASNTALTTANETLAQANSTLAETVSNLQAAVTQLQAELADAQNPEVLQGVIDTINAAQSQISGFVA